MSEAPEPATGIDLGTTFSCVAIYQNKKTEVFANEYGHRTTPSYVAFTNTQRLIGEAPQQQQTTNPQNTIFTAKRLIGLTTDDLTKCCFH